MWEDVSDRNMTDMSDYSTYRKILFFVLYKNIEARIYLYYKRGYCNKTGKEKKLSNIKYAFKMYRDGEQFKPLNTVGIFKLPIETNKANLKKKFMQYVDQYYYVLSGQSDFDTNKKIKILHEENKTKTVLKNMERYIKFFKVSLTTLNVYDIVNKCVEHFDEFEYVFSEYNSLMEMEKKYVLDMEKYNRLDPSCRANTRVVDRKAVTKYRPTYTRDTGYWGEMTFGGESYVEYENVYGYNADYVKPPSRKEIDSKQKIVDSLAEQLSNKLK